MKKPICDPTPVDGTPTPLVVPFNSLCTIILLVIAIGSTTSIFPPKAGAEFVAAYNSFYNNSRNSIRTLDHKTNGSQNSLSSYAVCPGQSLCPERYPICCDGYCISAGDKCCTLNSNSCDPGEECCMGGGCCKPGTSCDVLYFACVPDPVCAVIYDAGTCIQPGGHYNSTTKVRTLCMWDCMERRCTTLNRNPLWKQVDYLFNETQQCRDVCNMGSTCRSCIEDTLDNFGAFSCTWCSSSQTCYSNSSAHSVRQECYMQPLLNVMSAEQCPSIMWRGKGLYTTSSNMAVGGESIFFSKTGLIILLCLTFITVFGIGIAIVRILCILRHSPNELFHGVNEEGSAQQQVAAVVAAIPRYGFIDEEYHKKDNGSDTDKKRGNTKENKKKLKKKVNINKINTTTADEVPRGTTRKESNKSVPVTSSKCSKCHLDIVCEAPLGAESNWAIKWTHVVLFPCRHSICKGCLLSMQEDKKNSMASSTGDKSFLSRTLRKSSREGAADSKPNRKGNVESSSRRKSGATAAVRISEPTPSSALSTDVIPLSNDYVNEKAVLALLPTDKTIEGKAPSSSVSTAGVWGPERKQLERAGQQQVQLELQVALYAGKKCPFCESECTLLFIPTKMMKE